MLYFSLKVKIKGPKEKWGTKEKVRGWQNFVRAGIRAPHIQFASYAYAMYMKLETVSIAEPLQNRQHARETPNAVNTRRERE